MTKPSIENILTAYRAASQDDHDYGMSWYPSARDIAAALSPDNVESGAGVIAALSPRTSWPLNLRRAGEVFATGTTGGLKKNAAKAVAIYNGAAPLDVLSGPKTRSFYVNIMGINSLESVTVDRHAIDIACGQLQNDKERAAAIRGKAGYATVANMYLEVADSLGITGAELQAIVWVYWRRNVTKAFFGDE